MAEAVLCVRVCARPCACVLVLVILCLRTRVCVCLSVFACARARACVHECATACQCAYLCLYARVFVIMIFNINMLPFQNQSGGAAT